MLIELVELASSRGSSVSVINKVKSWSLIVCEILSEFLCIGPRLYTHVEYWMAMTLFVERFLPQVCGLRSLRSWVIEAWPFYNHGASDQFLEDLCDLGEVVFCRNLHLRTVSLMSPSGFAYSWRDLFRVLIHTFDPYHYMRPSQRNTAGLLIDESNWSVFLTRSPNFKKIRGTKSIIITRNRRSIPSWHCQTDLRYGMASNGLDDLLWDAVQHTRRRDSAKSVQHTESEKQVILSWAPSWYSHSHLGLSFPYVPMPERGSRWVIVEVEKRISQVLYTALILHILQLQCHHSFIPSRWSRWPSDNHFL